MSKTNLFLKDAKYIGANILASLNNMGMITAGILAGSIRREVDTVGDIELLVFAKYGVPRDVPVQVGMFSDKQEKQNLFDLYTPELFGGMTPLSPGKKDGSKYKQWIYQLGKVKVNVDCFICHDYDQWGLLLALRTGSAAFMRTLATHVKQNLPGILWKDARLWRQVDGEELTPIPTPTEAKFFEAIGLQYVAPQFRNERSASILILNWEHINAG